MASNSIPTNLLDQSIATSGHVLTLQSEVSDRKTDDVELVEGKDDMTVGDAVANKGIVSLKSQYAAWTQPAMMRKFWRMYLLGVLVAQAGMYAGYIDSSPGSIVANPAFIKQFAEVTDPKTGKPALLAKHVSAWGTIQQCITFGSMVTMPILADAFGRRIFMWLFILIGSISVILEMVARNWIVWGCAKAFCGLAMGMIAPGPLTMISEIVYPQMRGSLLCAFAVSWSVGGIFSSVGLQVLVSVSPGKYLPMIYSEWIFVFIYIVIAIFSPESPAWLISKGRMDKARKAHRYIVGEMVGYDYDHEFEILVQDVTVSRQLVKEQRGGQWRALFEWRNFRRVLIPVLPSAGANIVGGAYVYSYTTYFFQQAGLNNPFVAGLVVSFVGLFGLLCSIFLFDRVGRRPLMVWGTLGCSLLSLAIGGLAFRPINSSVGAGLITLTAFWVLSYSLSFFAIAWSALVEVQTPLLRAKAGSMAAALANIAKIMWNYVVPLMLSDQNAGWGAKVGLFFGGLGLLWLIPMYLYFPETRGRTYPALDDLFTRGISHRKFDTTPSDFDSDEFKASMEKRKKGVSHWLAI